MSVLESTLQKLSEVEIKKGDANFSEYTELVLEKIREMNEKKTRGRVAKAKDVDPDRVKRPSPASWMFRDENRAKIIAEHFDGQKTKGSEVAKKAKEVWDDMSEEDRKPWTDRHDEMWAAYKTANPGSGAKSSTPSSPFDVESPTDVEVPSEWNGPHEGKILYKTIPGHTSRGVGKFTTFAAAVEAANGLDTCGGITYDNKNGYQLRVGSDPNTPPSSTNGEVCWAKEGHVMKSPPKKARGGKKKVSGPTDEEMEKAQAAMFGADTDEESGGPTTEKVVTSDEGDGSESDSDSDGEEDDEEEEMVVIVWEYKGKEYLLDETSGDVYSYDDDQKKIGKKTEKGKLKLTKK